MRAYYGTTLAGLRSLVESGTVADAVLHGVTPALREAMHTLDLSMPVWLPQHQADWDAFGLTRFLPDHTFRITDETDYPGLIALTLMSVEKPSAEADRILWGKLATCQLTGAEKISICPVPVSDPRLRTAWPEILYRTRIYFHHKLQLEIN